MQEIALCALKRVKVRLHWESGADQEETQVRRELRMGLPTTRSGATGLNPLGAVERLSCNPKWNYGCPMVRLKHVETPLAGKLLRHAD